MEVMERCSEKVGVNRGRNGVGIGDKPGTCHSVDHAGTGKRLIPEFEVVIGIIDNGNEIIKSTLPFHSFVFARKVLAILHKDWELAYIRKRRGRDELY